MAALLVVTVLGPLAGALAIAAVGRAAPGTSRQIALVTTIVVFAMAALLTRGFVTAGPDVFEYAVADLAWLSPESGVDIRFSLGLDGLSLWMFALSALLMITSVLVSWEAIQQRPSLFYGMLLLLETGCLGVFAARDIMLFYVFFEFTLIPLFFLIGIWGSEQRRYAAIKFFLYTLAGSLLTFLGLLTIILWVAGAGDSGKLVFSIPLLTEELATHPLPAGLQMAVFVALFAGFAIKVPLFPLHTWLPLAHVQAPTAGSVILAGILLKIGTYGFVRFSLPMLPTATATCAPWLLVLSVTGIVYGALVALAQSDIKRLIAYSSVSHLGFCMLGLFALNRVAGQGAMLQMVNHGLSTGALFAIVGMLYERYHTRAIGDYSGLARRLPWLTFFMLLFTLSSIGLPGLNGFTGEFMILVGMFQRGFAEAPPAMAALMQIVAVLAVSGVVLGAWYMLWLVQRVCFGPLLEPHHNEQDQVADLNAREILSLVPLAVFVVWIGLCPNTFLKPMEKPLNIAIHSAAEQMALEMAEAIELRDLADDTVATAVAGRRVQDSRLNLGVELREAHDDAL